jgi:hypothetical protein
VAPNAESRVAVPDAESPSSSSESPVLFACLLSPDRLDLTDAIAVFASPADPLIEMSNPSKAMNTDSYEKRQLLKGIAA